MPPSGTRGNRGGRPPKPTKLLLLQGTARKDRHAKRAREPSLTGDGALPPPPEDLQPEVRAAWDELAASIQHKIYTKDDVHAFRTFAEMWATHKKCYEDISERGITESSYTKDGREVSQMTHEARMWNDLNGKLLQYFGRFGMTPADRARVQMVGNGDNSGKKENPDDEFARQG